MKFYNKSINMAEYNKMVKPENVQIPYHSTMTLNFTNKKKLDILIHEIKMMLEN